MRTDQGGLFEFGAFRLDATERRLVRDGHPVSLTPKAFHTLVLLVENRGHVLGKEELIREVWPDSFVEEGGTGAQHLRVAQGTWRQSGPPAFD